MAPSYISDCVKLLLTITLIFVISTESTKQCASEKMERGSYVKKNIGIKLCQLKCAEHGLCASVEYNIETLTCHLLRGESKIEKKEGPDILERNHSHVSTVSCTSGMCSFGQRCLKTRSGKEVCVQAAPSPATVYNLYNTSRDGDLESVKQILAAGHVDINMRGGQYSRTSVMAAARWGHRGVVDLLVGRGADVSLVDKDGNNILLLACVGENLETVKLILSLNVLNINTRGQYSRTPVMVAARWGHRGVVEFLVGRGADVSLVDKDGNNILLLACVGGDLETVKLILSLNLLDINSRGQYSRTPVMVAARWGHRGVVEFLVGREAGMSLLSKYNKTVLHLACFGGDLETVKLILSLNVLDINTRGGYYRRTPVMMAAWRGQRDVVEILIGRGADMSLVDKDGHDILHVTCLGGDVETVELILSLNVQDINAGGGYHSKTPMMMAVQEKHRDLADFLLGRGADLALLDANGNTVLHYACFGGDLEIIKLILSLNVLDIDARNKKGQTAAEWARVKGHPQILKILEARGDH